MIDTPVSQRAARLGLAREEVFAILTYVIDLAEGMIILPWTYQQWICAREIGGRITAE